MENWPVVGSTFWFSLEQVRLAFLIAQINMWREQALREIRIVSGAALIQGCTRAEALDILSGIKIAESQGLVDEDQVKATKEAFQVLISRLK